jgi:putative transposase
VLVLDLGARGALRQVALYTSTEFAQLCAHPQVVKSMGATGICWDNAAAESFFATLKRELVHRYRFPDRASARRAIFAWINRYNHHRLHSSLGYVPPVEWEHLYHQHPADQAA